MKCDICHQEKEDAVQLIPEDTLVVCHDCRVKAEVDLHDRMIKLEEFLKRTQDNAGTEAFYSCTCYMNDPGVECEACKARKEGGQ